MIPFRLKPLTTLALTALCSALLPGVGIYADIIAGYPAETEKDFADALAYVRDIALSGLHVFSFSARPGTRAAALKALPPSVVSERSAALRSLDADMLARGFDFARSLAATFAFATLLLESEPDIAGEMLH